MSVKKLHYFNVPGLGEATRYILHYAGEKFEDVRYDNKMWPIPGIKESLPFGQLPIYEEDGRKLNQSIAITRYVAKKANLVPTDPWEEATLDAIVYNMYDLWAKFTLNFIERDPARKEIMKKQFLGETVDFFLSRFEKDLKNNGGFFTGKLTWADFILPAFVETINLSFNTKIEKNYPTIAASIKRIKELPGVKEYIAARGPYSFK